jgi:RNA ligase (TIGR02306 family)
MRILASVRRVRAINPIEGADFIVKAQVDGWECVAKKGEFNVGDLGVYFEIDSFLPGQDPRYAFLEKTFITYEGVVGARIRTQKFKGQIAQGLLLPLNLFPEVTSPMEGMDLTAILGIKKWERAIPAELAGEIEGAFPVFIRKTDEERIQNLIDVLPIEIAGQTFEQTVKLDGTSMTVFFTLQEGQSVSGVCGRNWWLRETENNSLWRVARRNRLLEALVDLGRPLALQGELIGEGIQGNNEKLKGQEFFLFNVFDIATQCYLSPEERQAVANELRARGATVKEVPTLGLVTFPTDTSVDAILAMADGPSLNATNREGLVFKRLDGQFSFKAISNWYLAKYADR